MRDIPAEILADFFRHQPEEAYTYFKPHGFDEKSIKRLQRNRAFLGYVLIDNTNNKIGGYCFNRCFVHGQGYRGRMVDIDYRGKGLGTTMNKILNEVGFSIGLRLFETVSKDNLASYNSAISASKIKIIKELSHDELFLEILPEGINE
jgi:RimJ/RimL family protein N-acetyltransferase